MGVLLIVVVYKLSVDIVCGVEQSDSFKTFDGRSWQCVWADYKTTRKKSRIVFLNDLAPILKYSQFVDD